uniref:Uncharacterized protein n=1 Tax=Anguilla anguilla TaxID=7936 RepID=A0A0E9UIL9_ANGAN
MKYIPHGCNFHRQFPCSFRKGNQIQIYSNIIYILQETCYVNIFLNDLPLYI